jgi:tetratricopeptide (TPR) repeat protein
MRTRLLFCTVLLAAASWAAPLLAQVEGGGAPGQTLMQGDMGNLGLTPQAEKVTGGRIYLWHGGPAANAQVEVTNNVGAAAKIMTTDKTGEFHVEFDLFDVDAGKRFVATIKVTKKGYEKAYRYVPMEGTVNSRSLAIELHPLEPPDPLQTPLARLIETEAPQLRQPGPADGLAAKEAKDYAHGVQEFLERDRPERAVPLLAKAVSASPSCLKCRSMLALAELKWGDWDDAHEELKQSINALIENPKVAIAQPLLIYGMMLNWDHDPSKARPYLANAVKHAPKDALALQELGRAECQDLFWYEGSVSLKQALDNGAGPDARLMYAEALVWTGRPDQAGVEINKYLGGRDPKSMPPHVREICDRIKAGKKDETMVRTARARAAARGVEPLDYLHHPPKIQPDFEPTTDQAALSAILAAVGKNVADMFANLPNVCAVEQIHQERLDREGKTFSGQNYKYRYLALAPEEKWGPSLDELRADMKGHETVQLGLSDNAMLTMGFISAPLVFHPAYQHGSSFRLLGRQKVDGRMTYVIAYAQQPEKSILSGSFVFGSSVLPTYSQGLAWVDARNSQIIRLTSDLLNPLPQVRLDKQTTVINFQEVGFKQLPRKFWLPNAVTVTLDLHERVYRNHHSYSDFILSQVASTERIGKPKDADKIVEEEVDPAPNGSTPENSSTSFASRTHKH